MNALQTEPRYLFPKAYADVVQRLRVVSGFLLLLAFAWFSNPTGKSTLFGIPISVAGLAIRAWAAGHLVKNEQLATTGPYAYMRNPLYAGTLLTAAGIVVACRSLILGAVFATIFVLVYLPVIELEEQHLRSLFPSYAEYASRVNRFLPFRRWTARTQPFSAAVYLRNEEYKALLGFVIAISWLMFKMWLASRSH